MGTNELEKVRTWAQTVSVARLELKRAEEEAVNAWEIARESGNTLQEIADAAAVTKQAVSQRLAYTRQLIRGGDHG